VIRYPGGCSLEMDEEKTRLDRPRDPAGAPIAHGAWYSPIRQIRLSSLIGTCAGLHKFNHWSSHSTQISGPGSRSIRISTSTGYGDESFIWHWCDRRLPITLSNLSRGRVLHRLSTTQVSESILRSRHYELTKLKSLDHQAQRKE
jgi:hypothetical protein